MNLFKTYYRHFWKFVPSSIVTALLSCLIITMGPASVGMTHVARNIAWGRHSFGLSDFFDAIKENLKQSFVVGIFNIIIYLLIFFDFYFFNAMDGIFAIIGNGIMFGFFIIFTIMNYYIWTLMITFDFTIRQIYKNSFKFVFVNFKYNIICLLLKLFIYALYIVPIVVFTDYFLLVVTIEGIIYMLTFPAFKYLLVQACIFPSVKQNIIDPYYEEHPDLDIDKRRSLGLEFSKDFK